MVIRDGKEEREQTQGTMGYKLTKKQERPQAEERESQVRDRTKNKACCLPLRRPQFMKDAHSLGAGALYLES